MQQTCKVGTTLHAMVGPMGIPSSIRSAKKVVCVGGGLGVAPIFPQARGFKEAGAYVIGVLGFRTKSLVFWEDKFRACCDELILCTDDGTAGLKGLVTEGIRRSIAKHADIDEVVAIGPPVMMKGLRRGDARAQDQDSGEPQPDHGRRHRDVRRLPRVGRRRDEATPAWTAPSSMPTWWTSTT
jgi:NAD(P)H-flavin reductase